MPHGMDCPYAKWILDFFEMIRLYCDVDLRQITGGIGMCSETSSSQLVSPADCITI